MFTMWTHRFDLIVYEVLKSRNKRDELKDETCKMQKNIYIYIYIYIYIPPKNYIS